MSFALHAAPASLSATEAEDEVAVEDASEETIVKVEEKK